MSFSSSSLPSRSIGGSDVSAEARQDAEVIEFPSVHTGKESRRWRDLTGSEAGMATAEYAIATLAAVAFAGLLVLILRSGEVRGLLMNLVELALTAV